MSPSAFSQSTQALAATPQGAEFLAPFFEEIYRRVDRRVVEAVERALAQKAAESAEQERNGKLLNDRQTADVLGVKPKTVHVWKQRGILPSHRLGGRVFYKLGEVLEALASQTQADGRRKYARRGSNEKGL